MVYRVYFTGDKNPISEHTSYAKASKEAKYLLDRYKNVSVTIQKID